jgi:hypothetical protein
MPKGKKHTPEQVIAIFRRIDGSETAQAVSLLSSKPKSGSKP